MSINIDKINNVKTNNSLNCNPKKVSFAKSKDMPNDSFEFSRPITVTINVSKYQEEFDKFMKNL